LTLGEWLFLFRAPKRIRRQAFGCIHDFNSDQAPIGVKVKVDHASNLSRITRVGGRNAAWADLVGNVDVGGIRASVVLDFQGVPPNGPKWLSGTFGSDAA